MPVCASHNICDIIDMSNEELQKLIDERTRLVSELCSLCHLVHGSLVERYMVCSRPNCKCHRGQRHGPVMCIVVNEDGRQRQKYVPKEMHELARRAVADHGRALELLDKISAINLRLIQEKCDE